MDIFEMDVKSSVEEEIGIVRTYVPIRGLWIRTLFSKAMNEKKN